MLLLILNPYQLLDIFLIILDKSISYGKLGKLRPNISFSFDH